MNARRARERRKCRPVLSRRLAERLEDARLAREERLMVARARLFAGKRELDDEYASAVRKVWAEFRARERAIYAQTGSAEAA